MKIIQIGANNGNDDVFHFIKRHQDFLELAILIEPIPFVIDELKNQYKDLKNIVVENIAIYDDENKETMTLYYLENSNYEVSSFIKSHVIEHNVELSPLLELEVPCSTINKILDKYKLDTVDFLFIDVEGLDVYLISSIDFAKYNIKNIIFEYIHTDGAFQVGSNLQETVDYLRQLGYTLSVIDERNIRAELIL